MAVMKDNRERSGNDSDLISSTQDETAASSRTQPDESESEDLFDEPITQPPANKPRKRKQEAFRGAKGANSNADGGESRPSKKWGRPTKRSREEDAKVADDEDDKVFIPDCVRDRRGAFDQKRAVLKDSGLRLAPSYDEVDFSDDDKLDELQEKPEFPGRMPVRSYEDKRLLSSAGLIPASIAQWLREYQIEGAAFLHKLFVRQEGGILGDDMGLGKTIQVIAFLTAAFGKTGDERDDKRMRKIRRLDAEYPRVLLICPGSLIPNWQDELQRWGWWHIDVYHGSHKDSALTTMRAGRCEVMITTYATYRGAKDEVNGIPWDCVIADECHIIKDRKSETTQAINEVNALCRIGLTGTAIQNNYDELWTLLNWTNPGRFGGLADWKHQVSEPLKLGQSHEATMHQLGHARKTAQALVDKLLPQFFLRRMKSLIANQLPKKSDRVVVCPLTHSQTEAYETYLESDAVRFIKLATTDCLCGSKKKLGCCCEPDLPKGYDWKAHFFPALFNLLRICNHLATLIPQSGDPKERQERDLETLRTALPGQWQELYRTRGSTTHFSNSDFCGKWKVLKKLLRFWHGAGDKVLVFSRSVRLLRMLRILFQHTAYNVSYLDGAMSYDDRAREVDGFNRDPNQFVFLISTKAGGVGLNIASANKVVVVDPDWNPATDSQAQDRAYRIGQARDVEVFRLVSAGTIEELVYARQIYKQQQANIGYTASRERRYFRGVQNHAEQKGEIFGLSNLLTSTNDRLVLREIVHNTNVAESRAGVAVLDVDLSDPASQNTSASHDADHDGLSQLVALAAGEDVEDPSKPEHVQLKGDSTSRSNPISAILAGAGVTYTHEHAEVVGSSRIETHLSRKALLVRPSDGQADALPVFAPSEGNARRYRPPEAVRKRQFCSMAQSLGFESTLFFALEVESWTQEQRRECLDRFYEERKRRSGLNRKSESVEAVNAGADAPDVGHYVGSEQEEEDEEVWLL